MKELDFLVYLNFLIFEMKSRNLLKDSLFALESTILFRMMIFCVLSIFKIMVDTGKLLKDASILSILIQQQ